MKFKTLLIALVIVPVFSIAAMNQAPVNTEATPSKENIMKINNHSFVTQKTLQWEWTEGPYAGAVYENTFNADGSMIWKGIKGGEKGQSRTEQYVAYDISDDVSVASWFEPSVGATVNVILNSKSHEIYGFISDKEGRIILKGHFSQIK